MKRPPSTRAAVFTLCGLITAIGGAYAAGPSFGLNLPRWAWHQELEDVQEDLVKVAQQSKDNTYLILQGRLIEISLRISANDIQQTAYTATGKNPPQWLFNERTRLVIQKADIERSMKKLDR